MGVDDFALRRGRTYGTILIDITASRPVDVLPERSSDALAAWLRDRPGVEVVCRDRAGCYADRAKRGAPQAIQVADRWHMWRDLGDAVERTRWRHALVHRLLAQGRDLRAIARELQLARITVRRFVPANDPEELLAHNGTGNRPKVIDERTESVPEPVFGVR